MKIENSDSVSASSRMLYKGSVETARNNIKEQESERLKSVIQNNKTSASVLENKGIHFDAKA